MAKDAKIPLNLMPVDELFSTQAEYDDQKRDKVEDIGIELLAPYCAT